MDLHLVRPQGQWSDGGAAIYPNTDPYGALPS